MEYIAKTEVEDGTVLVEFPDCPGCQTEGANREDAWVQAHEALIGWLETHLQAGKLPPRPAFKGKGIAVSVPAALGLKLQLRWARADAGLTQSDLAKRLGVTQQMIAKLEHPDYEPSLSKAELVAKALGLNLSASLVAPQSAAQGPKRAAGLMAALSASLAVGKKQKAPTRTAAQR